MRFGAQVGLNIRKRPEGMRDYTIDLASYCALSMLDVYEELFMYYSQCLAWLLASEVNAAYRIAAAVIVDI